MNTTDKQQELLTIMDSRRAIKSFDPTKKISDEDFEFILEVGRRSPSSVGYEPWRFLVLQNEEIREQIREVSFGAKGQLPTASHFVIILARKDARYDSNYIDHLLKNVKKISPDIVAQMKGAYKNFQEVDMKILDDERNLFDWASKQTYLALANMMTMAQQIGIDSCPIEGFNYEAVTKILVENKLLDPEVFGVSVMAAFGYKENDPEFKSVRQPLTDIVQWIN
ncbi:MAG: NAD(P)H-dependent oxidoreductase [Carnobacterium sp.]|uniref:NAD(P)H-dependent oxidoreductase n=1 Tax=Carnobacterium sp. TaxID=48221 RepID=UPI002FC7FC3E